MKRLTLRKVAALALLIAAAVASSACFAPECDPNKTGKDVPLQCQNYYWGDLLNPK